MLGVINGDDAILDGDALTRESDDPFDDIFIVTEGWIVIRIFKDDDLAALGDILLILKLFNRDRQSVNDQAVIGVHGVFHTWSLHTKATKNKGIDQNCSDDYPDYKNNQSQTVPQARVSIEKVSIHPPYYTWFGGENQKLDR